MKNKDLPIFKEILEKIKNLPDVGPFLFPVPYRKLGLFDYPKIIKYPMDISTLEKRVKLGLIEEKDAFVKELNLIWSNCLLYNQTGSGIYRQAERMKLETDTLIYSFFQNEDSTSESAAEKEKIKTKMTEEKQLDYNKYNHSSENDKMKESDEKEEEKRIENVNHDNFNDNDDKQFELVYNKRMHLNELVSTLHTKYFEEIIKIILKENPEACEKESNSRKLLVKLDDLTLKTTENLIHFCEEKQSE